MIWISEQIGTPFAPVTNWIEPVLPTRPVRLLFVCTGNSCRSQMAEAWARVLLGDACEPQSAGITSHGLDPHAIAVMAERGLNISGSRSKTVDEFHDLPIDGIITLSERARLHFPYAWYDAPAVHVPFDAPRWHLPSHANAGDGLDEYRRVRDEIQAFVASLANSHTLPTARHTTLQPA